ncbi:MAG: DNA polymerase, partial [Cyanobacteria bacterium J06553_1]
SIHPKTVNILLVSYQGLQHYCGISSLRRLYYFRGCHTTEFCERCCRRFSSWRNSRQEVKESLAEHYRFCREGRLQIQAVPGEKNYSYTNYAAEESPVVVCYSDIESYIEPQTKKHCPAMIGMYPVYHEHFTQKREQATMRAWSGERCIKKYLDYLDAFVRELYTQMDPLTRQPMQISPTEQIAFDNATHCPRCKTAFTEEGRHRKVRDHCHITGKFRSPLCHVCNSRLMLKRRVLPVVFHNFKGYDGHLICKQAIGEMPGWHVDVIPTTHEKYMSVIAKVEVGRTKKGKLRYFSIVFLDSFQFLSSSLASLASNLDHLPFTDKRMRSRYPNVSDDVLHRKGVFPYSYFDSPSRLQETSLPSIDKFKDDLSGSECTPEEYAHAERAWSELDCRSFREYLAGYLYLDIYLLTDVFEEFRKMSLREDGLDPVHFVSLPGLSYSACFKRTGETIDLLQDIDMVQMFERGIRGGLTFVNKHHVQAHIPELNNNQDGNIHLTYIDQNNLYGSSLCRPLPHSEFSWVDDEGLKQFSNPQQILDLNDE